MVCSVTGMRDRLVAPIDPAWAQGHGKLAIVTGSNAGIGKYTAAELHRRGRTLHARACCKPSQALHVSEQCLQDGE